MTTNPWDDDRPDDALPLPELIDRHMARLGIESSRQLALKAGLGKDAVRLARSGARGQAEETLRKLADVFDVPVTVVRHSAGRPRGEQVPFVVPLEWSQLTYPQRQVLHNVAAALLQASESSAHAPTPPPTPTTHSHIHRYAARKRSPEQATTERHPDDHE